MSENSYSDDSLSDGEEDLDPRIQDGLEKLNAATDGINHLEHELDEARAYFRQTLASASANLNYLAKKLGKCVEKARPFYDSLRALRQAHFLLQKAALQYERANSMHVAAKRRVREQEQRVYSSIEKRAFDTALQEVLNVATIEVNTAEESKRINWNKHQEASRKYCEIHDKANHLHSKLKKSIEKSKPYFELKVGLDRHLLQQKQRVDSIQKGLAQAKEAYTECLKSLEAISDEIHQKRKDKKMQVLMSKLQRGQGVGADSSDEASLTVSNLDLDLNTDDIDGTVHMLCDNLSQSETLSISEVDNVCAELQKAVVSQAGCELRDPNGDSDDRLERAVMGSEAGDISPIRNTLQREVDGLESENEDDDVNETSGNLAAQGVLQDKKPNKVVGENFNESSMDDTANGQMQDKKLNKGAEENFNECSMDDTANSQMRYNGELTVHRDISTKDVCEFDVNNGNVEYDEEEISTPVQETAANNVQN